MPCSRCGFNHNCICHAEPQLDCSAHFILLTHPRELSKDTNTGVLMTRSLPNCSVEIWDRTRAPEILQQPDFQTWLVFPADPQQPATPFVATDNPKQLRFVILDATWQEAKKMIRKSPWLASLPRLALEPQGDSHYTLRRNQQSGHLCTCEVGIELLTLLDEKTQAKQLEQYLDAFIDTFHADKSGHTKK